MTSRVVARQSCKQRRVDTPGGAYVSHRSPLSSLRFFNHHSPTWITPFPAAKEITSFPPIRLRSLYSALFSLLPHPRPDHLHSMAEPEGLEEDLFADL